VASVNTALVRLLPAVPKPVVRRLSARYIAGSTLADASRVVAELNRIGMAATVDVLGEEITNPDEARAITQEYEEVLEEFQRAGLDSNVSVKLTALGLKLDKELCRANLEEAVDDAGARGNFVRIDMEDSSTTDDTLGLYRDLRASGRDNVGVVLQAALRRTVGDVEALVELSPNVRLCKGIYIEPEEISFRDPDAVRANFVRALTALIDAGCYVGIATHDQWLVDEGRRLVRERGLGVDRYEFQMLLGVRPELGRALVREGHRLRIYVPFGRDWYAYSLRRLQENPRIAGYVAADALGRLIPGRRRETELAP
jgi:proline dehydrogenase